MKIKFLGAARTVTGSFYFMETDKTTFAIDCGMFQGSEELEERNSAAYTVKPESVDFLILTHAHIDHSGLIPKLCKAGFKGNIYCSSATKDLCKVMLPDSGHIQEWEANQKNYDLEALNQPAIEPIYTVQNAANALKQFRTVELNEVTRVAGDVRFRFREAGHILGSCIVEIWVEEANGQVKLVFSGDLGQPAQPFVRDPAVIEDADYLVVESTYGDRLHPELTDRTEELKVIIDETMIAGGNLIIPSFAVERAQDLLYDLSLLQSQDRLDPKIEIYLDSPLAIKATEIFKQNFDLYDRETRHLIKEGHHPLKMPNLKYSTTKAESIKLNEKRTNTIIISASGMCDAGRIQHHLLQNLWRPESTILFVGYQAEGTLGRQIVSGDKDVEVLGKQITVNARIEDNRSYSAHADQRDLLKWIGSFKRKPKTVYIVHGEENAQAALSKKIEEELKLATVIPDWLDQVELEPLTV